MIALGKNRDTDYVNINFVKIRVDLSLLSNIQIVTTVVIEGEDHV